MPMALTSMMIRPGKMIPRHAVNKPERAVMVKSNAMIICVSLGMVASFTGSGQIGTLQLFRGCGFG